MRTYWASALGILCWACGGDESSGKTVGAEAGAIDGATAGSGGGAAAGASAGGAGGGGVTGLGGAVASGGGGAGAAPDASPGGSDAAAGSGGVAAGGGASGILDAGIGGADASVEPPPPPLVLTNQVDLLLVMDNSISMADKQELFADAVPDFVRRLVNPDCVDVATGARTAPPADPMGPCPAPYSRAFAPVTDLHLGIISSSLGTPGASTCSGTEERDDFARLIGSRPRALDLGLATVDGGLPGYLAWRPEEDLTQFSTQFQSLVGRVGEHGCGYEATLEAWYRFLVDPEPAADFVSAPCSDAGPELCAVPTGIDDQLLAQRAAFLRPDSALVVVMISDENDCSIRRDGQLYLAGAYSVDMPRASTACDTNPNDACCYACDEAAPDGCTDDPICTSSPTLSSSEDGANLRCFHQKQRFGRDYLYPVDRYSRALTARTICPSNVDLDTAGCPDVPVDNPIYAGSASGRSPELVVLMGIVGVPWQDLQALTSPTGLAYPTADLQYQTAAQMTNAATWELILGEGSASPPVAPVDPLMRESSLPRTGTQPITGEPLVPPGGNYLENSVNGHEWNANLDSDLQFACIMPIAAPRDCADPANSTRGCDCAYDPATLQNPVCQLPDGGYSTVQQFAKAFPGTRHLEVLKQLGERGVVTSICARNVTDTQRQDFGYGPATDALMRRLGAVLLQ